MSEPNRISLRDTAGATLIEGTADFFLVGSDGQRWPLLSASAPMTLVGPSGGDFDLIAVGRADAVLSPVTAGDDPEPLDSWCAALRGRYPQELADLVPTDRASVREQLTRFATQQVTQQLDRQQQARTVAAAAESQILESTRVRLMSGVQHGGDVRFGAVAEDTSKLTKVFQILGAAQGFTARQPTNRAAEADPVAAVAQASGVRFRKVQLSDGWSDSTKTALLGFISAPKDGAAEPVALLPTRRGYQIQRSGQLEPTKLTPTELASLEPRAFQIYVPFPHDRVATIKDMAKLASHGTSRLWTLIVACAAISALLALLTPVLTGSVLGLLVPEDASGPIVAVGVALVVVAISSGILTMVQNFATSELTQLGQLRVESALWDRTLSLPLKFFRQYASGDMVTRLMAVDQLKSLLSSQTVTAVLAAVFSLVNFVLLFTYSVPLGIVALLFVIATAFVIVRLTLAIRTLTSEQLTAQRGATAWVVQLITGISKVRVAGAEDRFTALTMDIEAQMINAQSKQTLQIGRLQAYLGAVAAFAPMCFFIVVGTVMWGPTGATISSSTYIAFSTAFGAVLGAIVGLVAAVPAIAMISPTLDLIRPILESTQTQAPNAKPLGTLHGKIELRGVEFQYQPSTPLVLQGLSLTINPGEFTAIVGPSGSGKTSTLRIFTGVEQPDAGQVLVDGHDLRDIDGDDYRRRIGTVIQGGALTPGSILDNIAGGAEITEDQAWQAAEDAAIADDIRAMPMHMHTRVNANTISGGQVQRILIARALARDPKILLFDEATSALDNESQADVMRAMSQLPITRVVVAHRLSTVMNADRILVIADGRLVQDGTYDSLLNSEGIFADLAKRQLATG